MKRNLVLAAALCVGPQSMASSALADVVLTKDKAQLWINHDKTQRDTLKMAPELYD